MDRMDYMFKGCGGNNQTKSSNMQISIKKKNSILSEQYETVKTGNTRAFKLHSNHIIEVKKKHYVIQLIMAGEGD